MEIRITEINSNMQTMLGQSFQKTLQLSASSTLNLYNSFIFLLYSQLATTKQKKNQYGFHSVYRKLEHALILCKQQRLNHH